MRQDDEATLGSTLMIFLAGAAVGAVVAALVTPRSGTEVRGDLGELGRRTRRRAEDLAQGARDTWHKVRGRAARAAGEVGRDLADAGRNVAEAINDIRC
jgi:gas vesicle protein